jgi:hypothetical protein
MNHELSYSLTDDVFIYTGGFSDPPIPETSPI